MSHYAYTNPSMVYAMAVIHVVLIMKHDHWMEMVCNSVSLPFSTILGPELWMRACVGPASLDGISFVSL